MTIRSFVLRQGRMTPGQQRAFDNHWPVFGLELSESKQLDLKTLFAKEQPVILEIGFGMGDTLAEMAESHPELNFLGIEVHKPGVGHALRLAADKNLQNLKVIRDDAVVLLRDYLADDSLFGVHIYFPDPWHKKKHNKRRLIQASLLARLEKKLHQGGYIHIATDWDDYAEHIKEVFAESNAYKQSDKVIQRPETKFERRGLKLGHSISEFVYVLA
jgi:tRNA (guanine-N7-)-methyltransferase